MNVLNEILPYLPSSVGKYVGCLSPEECDLLREIRIRAAGPMLLNFGMYRRIVSNVVHTKEEIDSTFRKICASSAYTHRHEIRSGFVTLHGGHRVGIVGAAVVGEGGRVEGMRDIVGLSFRVARDCDVPVSDLIHKLCKDGRIRNLLLVGPPCSGKTTLLRSLARELAKRTQVVVVDEREELFCSLHSTPVGCDVLHGFPKAAGILQALRTLSPGVIVCDEIGTEAEVSAMADGLRSGVALVTSAHAYDARDLLQRPPLRRLISVGGVDFAAFLDPTRLGEVSFYMEKGALCDEVCPASCGVPSLCGNGFDIRPGASGETMSADERH